MSQYILPTLEEIKEIRESVKIPKGFRRLQPGEVREEGDKYMDTAFFAGQWRPVVALIGETVRVGGAICIRKQ